MANPGPATTVTVNQQSLTTQQSRRLIAAIKGLNLGASGDTQVQTLLNSNFVPGDVVTVNSNGNVAAATVGIYTQPLQGGTAILTTSALTGQTSQTFAYVRQATANAQMVIPNNPYVYINVGTSVAGGTVDLYLYGFDVS